MKNRLESAYQQAWYQFMYSGKALRIHPGTSGPETFLPISGEKLRMQSGSAVCWVWMTAMNPGSKLLPAQENRLRHLLLGLDLARLGWLHGLGWSGSKDATWPVEQGYWCRPPDLSAACLLAQHYKQAAVLWGNHATPATLFWLA